MLAFYCCCPHPSGDWLNVPAPEFDAYLQMLPRLQAEDSLREISQTAAGSGAMKSENQRTYRYQLAHDARGGRREASHKATEREIRSIGIRVKHVGPKEVK